MNGSIRAATTIAVLLTPGWAVAAGTRTVFDVLEIDGIARALEAKALRDQAKPAPRPEFVQLIQARPNLLTTPDKGVSWRIRPRDEDDEKELPPPGLKQEDFTCAESLLQLPFVKKYVRCMRDAANGVGRGECLKDLIGLASQMGDGKDVLLASLQARVLRLASNNQEWRELAYGDKRPAYMDEMSDAYQRVETQKFLAALKFQPGQSGTHEIMFHDAFRTTEGELKVDWPDFDGTTLAKTSFKAEGAKTKVIGWRIAEGKASKVDLNTEGTLATLYTCELAPGRQVLLFGKAFTGDEVQSLRAQDTVDGIFKVTAGGGSKLFLSRSGSTTVGVLHSAK